MDLSDEAAIGKSIKALQTTVEKLVVPRHVSGTYPLEDGKAGLFYRNEDGSKTGWIDFTGASVDDSKLADLVNACEEAKFGLGNKDVLDPSYRKAWKLDASKFALQFDLVNSGILDTVHDALLQYEDSSMILEAHLDKMNVYGPGSFFKSHVDTPRDKNMLATLVIVLPTEHKGGDLLLLGKPWTFDSANLVAKSQSEKPQLAFVGFYSDVEHEVTPVESGYRVTVTYNLYCSKPLSPMAPKISLRSSPEEKLLREALRMLLDNDNVLPQGGVIAFGLTYKYPIDPEEISDLNATFQGLLKGSDALIERACKALNLKVKVQALYQHKKGADPVREAYRDSMTYLVDTTRIEAPQYDYENSESDLEKYLKSIGYAVKPFDYGHQKKSKRPVIWVTRPKELVSTKTAWMAYGNEASLDYIYGTLVLTARVPVYGKRKAVFDGEMTVSDATDSSDGDW